jgi:hypothetical protein
MHYAYPNFLNKGINPFISLYNMYVDLNNPTILYRAISHMFIS